MLGSLGQFRLGLRDYSGSSIHAFLTQQPGSRSSMLLLPEHCSAQKSFIFYAITTFRANILCVTFKTIPQASPPCLSHCIYDTLSLYSPHQPNQCLFGPQTHQMHSYLRPLCFCSSYSHHLEFSFISSLCGLITSRSLALREVHMVYVKKGAAL